MDYEFIKRIEEHMKSYREFPLPVIICDADFQVYWSNLCAKREYENLTRPGGIIGALAEFDPAALLEEIKSNGCCTIGETLPFSGARISLTPVLADGEIVGIIAMAISSGGIPEINPSHHAGKTATMLSSSIRRSIDGIFTSSDSAYLKSVIMDGTAWLSPHLSRIGANAYEILRVTSNIAEYAKYQNDIVIPKLSSEDIFGWLHGISGTVKTIAESVGIPVEFTIPDEPLYIRLDISSFGTALFNIIHNSLFFTRSGNRVTIMAKRGGGSVIITVSDNGQGMTDEVLASVFRPYFNAPNKDGYYGAGIGLTLAARIIQDHDGTIEIESRVGEGTDVTITLPAKSFSQPLPLAQGEKNYRLDDKFSNLYIGLLGITQFYYGEESE